MSRPFFIPIQDEQIGAISHPGFVVETLSTLSLLLPTQRDQQKG